MTSPDLDSTKAYKALNGLVDSVPPLSDLVSPDRIKSYSIKNHQITFNFACTRVNDKVLDALQGLADECGVIERYHDVLCGAKVNTSEQRSVLHHQTRGENRGHYGDTQEKINAFSRKIHQAGRFKSVVQIGIGGSELGPKVLIEGLAQYAGSVNSARMHAHFIGNIDTDHVRFLLDQLDIESTLFIIVSKSGATSETLSNLAFIRDYVTQKGVSLTDFKDQIVSVTSQDTFLDSLEEFGTVFYMDSAIGGRYSWSSAVGGAHCVFGLWP